MDKKRKALPGPDPIQPQRAGDIETLPGGEITFLAPLPLPTGEPALNEGAVSELNDTWLDYGAGWFGVFGHQLVLGGTFVSFLVMAYFLPLAVSPFISDALYRAVSEEAIKMTSIAAFFALAAGCFSKSISVSGRTPFRHVSTDSDVKKPGLAAGLDLRFLTSSSGILPTRASLDMSRPDSSSLSEPPCSVRLHCANWGSFVTLTWRKRLVRYCR